VSLQQLDAFLAHARGLPELRERLSDALELPEFLRLARHEGLELEEADVIAAQQREDSHLSDADLQNRAGVDARRLRNFIHG
jgi:predicted ribosomally synthesized peptide with nif11-like leader